MKTENQNSAAENKPLIKMGRSTSTMMKKSTMKISSVKPTRSLKRASGLKPNPLKLK